MNYNNNQMPTMANMMAQQPQNGGGPNGPNGLTLPLPNMAMAGMQNPMQQNPMAMMNGMQNTMMNPMFNPMQQQNNMMANMMAMFARNNFGTGGGPTGPLPNGPTAKPTNPLFTAKAKPGSVPGGKTYLLPAQPLTGKTFTTSQCIRGHVSSLTSTSGGARPIVFINKIPAELETDHLVKLLECCGKLLKATRGQDPLSGMPASFGYFEFEKLSDVFLAQGFLGDRSYKGMFEEINDGLMYDDMDGSGDTKKLPFFTIDDNVLTITCETASQEMVNTFKVEKRAAFRDNYPNRCFKQVLVKNEGNADENDIMQATELPLQLNGFTLHDIDSGICYKKTFPLSDQELDLQVLSSESGYQLAYSALSEAIKKAQNAYQSFLDKETDEEKMSRLQQRKKMDLLKSEREKDLKERQAKEREREEMKRQRAIDQDHGSKDLERSKLREEREKSEERRERDRFQLEFQFPNFRESRKERERIERVKKEEDQEKYGARDRENEHLKWEKDNLRTFKQKIERHEGNRLDERAKRATLSNDERIAKEPRPKKRKVAQPVEERLMERLAKEAAEDAEVAKEEEKEVVEEEKRRLAREQADMEKRLREEKERKAAEAAREFGVEERGRSSRERPRKERSDNRKERSGKMSDRRPLFNERENENNDATHGLGGSSAGAKDLNLLIQEIPESAPEVFQVPIDWEVLEQSGLLHSKVKPWIAKKLATVYEREVPEIADYVYTEVVLRVKANELVCEGGSSEESMVSKIEALLDEEGLKFCVKLWRCIILYAKTAKKTPG